MSDPRTVKQRSQMISLLRDDNGGLDDVSVAPVRLFRAEMMSEGELWMACYTGSSEDPTKWAETRFWIRAVKKGVLEFVVTDSPALKTDGSRS